MSVDPQSVEPKPTGEPKIDYLRSYQYIFDNPQWVQNVLLSAVAMIIPVVGGFVVAGYMFTVTLGLHQNRGAYYPDFSFDDFGKYLMKGLWPGLVGMVAAVAATPIIAILICCPTFVGGLLDSPLLATAGLVIANIIIVVALFALNIAIIPMALRAALTESLGEGFKVEWVKDFLSKVWLETLLEILFISITGSIGISVLGICTCGLGFLFLSPVVLLAQAFLLAQLYDLYLARGGEPIPIKEAPPTGPAAGPMTGGA